MILDSIVIFAGKITSILFSFTTATESLYIFSDSKVVTSMISIFKATNAEEYGSLLDNTLLLTFFALNGNWYFFWALGFLRLDINAAESIEDNS